MPQTATGTIRDRSFFVFLFVFVLCSHKLIELAGIRGTITTPFNAYTGTACFESAPSAVQSSGKE